MLVLGGICGIIALFVCMTDSMSRKRPICSIRIMMETENMGIVIESITTIMDDISNVYVSLTGDQCALTNIHIRQGKLGS